MLLENGGEIEEGARDRRDRDPVFDHDFILRQPGLVNGDAPQVAARAADGYFEPL
jgi:hypothetical protein